MAEAEAKVNMSLDDIIKMEKKKKMNQNSNSNNNNNNNNTRSSNYQRGGGNNNLWGGYRGNMMRGGGRGQNNRGGMRGRGGGMMYNNYNNNRNNYNNYNNNRNNYMNGYGRGAPYRRYSLNGLRGGFVQKRYNNYSNYNNYNQYNGGGNVGNYGGVPSNLRRSRSSMSLNRMSFNLDGGGYMNNYRGGGGGGGGGFRRSRSRSRSNMRYQSNNNSNYSSPARSYLQRTNSLPDLRSDDESVYNRLGYQNLAQAAYRNRVKRTRTKSYNNNMMNHYNTIINQKQSKNLKMQNALQISPMGKSLPPMGRQRRYSVGSVRSDQMMRAQRRAQYEQKIIRMNNARVSAAPIDYMSSLNEYVSKQHPNLNLYASQNSLRAQQLRSKSPFTPGLKKFQTIIPKTEPIKSPRRPQQRRARSRSRSRARSTLNSVIGLGLEGDHEDRSFSEVMYSLSNNFGVTGRTLNDRFSQF